MNSKYIFEFKHDKHSPCRALLTKAPPSGVVFGAWNGSFATALFARGGSGQTFQDNSIK